MTQQRSNDDIRADVRYLNEHEAQTGRRSSAHVLLTHDVEPLLARVSELEQENDRLHGVIAHTASDVHDYVRAALADARTELDAALARAERAEAQVRAVREQAESWRNNNPEASAYANAVQNCGDALVDLLAESGLSLQEEQE